MISQFHHCLSQLTQTCPSELMGFPELPSNSYGMLEYNQFIPLMEGNEFQIGRNLDSDLVLDGIMISRKHCIIKQIQGHACICVFGRTMLNNMVIENGFHLLNDLDVIKIGNTVIVFHSIRRERIEQDLFLADHNYSLGRSLGRGGYADVHVGMHVQSGKLYAIKITDIRVFERYGGDKEMSFSKLAHPNIAAVHESISTKLKNYMIMEYFADGDLFNYIHNNKNTPISRKEDINKWIMFQLLTASAHIHSYNVIHQDIKPENIVLSFSSDLVFPRIALSDFGLASTLKNSRCYDTCGTYPFIPPECLNGNGHDFKFDSWSIGIIMISLFKNEFSLDKIPDSKMNSFARNGKLQLNKSDFSGIPSDAAHLIQSLTHQDEHQRISCIDALSHPWITSSLHMLQFIYKKTCVNQM